MKYSHNIFRIEAVFLRDSVNKVFDNSSRKVNGIVILSRVVILYLLSLNIKISSYKKIR